MIRDYSKYEMNKREKYVVYILGYSVFAFVLFLFYRSLILSFIGGVAIVKAAPFYEKYRADKRMRILEFQFKDLLYSLSTSISSGRQMPEAIAEAHDNLSAIYKRDEPIMAELTHMKWNIVENRESETALLSDFAKRCKSDDINNFVQVYITCRNLGGNLEAIIGRTAEILTDKMNIQREIRAITAQKKLEGRIIALMPLAMLLALNLISPAYIYPLYSCVIGKLIMTVCLGTVIWGVWLMEKISTVEI